MRDSSQQSTALSDISFDDDADFVQALIGVGNQLSPVKSEAMEQGEIDLQEDDIIAVADDIEKGTFDATPEKQAYMETDAYRPNAFGDFRSYMKNKRLKLKVQEVSMTEDEARAAAGSSQPVTKYTTLPPLFKGTNIYINGHTNPPYGELRRLLHLYGGSLMPYLDQKTPCTHIIASNLTAKKRIEFKDYKLVRPEWVTESIEQGKRLNWRDYQCAEDASGAMKMGALQGRLRVGAKASSSTKSAEEAAERTKMLAARGDWRSLASEESSFLLPSNQSIKVLGEVGGIGPWGKSSRQKTLAGWGRKTDEEVSSSSQSETEQSHGVEEDKEQDSKTPKRSQSEEIWLDNLETPPKPVALMRMRDEGELGNEKLFPSLGTDPPSAAAAAAAGHGRSSHPYASRPSNIAAAKLLASPSWRERNTATSDEFLAGYFEKSRLHHLSTWKSEMKEMVSQALREAGKEQGSVDLPKGVKRVIMHIDFDAFFVSVGLRNRPDLHEKAVVVCHGTSTQEGSNNGTLHSTSEIASCNYIAREFGIRNGMSLGQANRLCNDVHTIPYDFVGYNEVAIQFYTILLLHADALEAVSIDEALIDVSLLLDEMRSGRESQMPERKRLVDHYKDLMNSQGIAWTEEKRLAEALRDEIRETTGCEASIGIGDNVLLARMATRKAKPGGSFYLGLEDFNDFAAELDVDDLHGVGWSIRNRCIDVFKTCKIGALTTEATKGKFMVEFGDKQGITIWDKIHGRERDRLESVKQRQSCGASINYAIRFEKDQEVKDFVLKLSKEVSNRLQAIHLVGKVCSISIMVRSKEAPVEAPKFLGHGVCDTFNRSMPFARPTDDYEVIFAIAWKLISALNVKADQLRGIGVSCQKLQPKTASHRAAASGQGLLTFTKAVPIVSVRESVPDEYLSNEEQEGKLLEPGPSGVTKRRRSITPEEHLPPLKSSGKPVELSLSSTQFVIPPASQLDPDVISALPEKIQAQIRSVQGTKKAGPFIARANSAEPTVRQPPKTPASVGTPEKHRTPVNPFLSMRAASTTPTKKSITQSQTQMAAYEMPSFSQLDPDVLAALPADVREEILREAKGSTSTRSSKLTSIAPLGVSSEAMSRRSSSSDTPRKKQRFLDAGGSSKLLGAEPRTPSKLIQRYNATDVAISVSAAASKLPSRALDPKQVTEQDLIRLEIDVEFFSALPEAVQREILQEQAKLVSDKQARFKSGKQIQELGLKEERRLQTQSAFAFDDDTFQAKRSNADGLVPNLKGQHTIFQIRQLLDTWFAQFELQGPRQKDVDRFKRFLIECVEVIDLDELDKVRSVLKWWFALLQQAKNTAHEDWSSAFAQVKDQVNAIVRVKFGAILSLK